MDFGFCVNYSAKGRTDNGKEKMWVSAEDDSVTLCSGSFTLYLSHLPTLRMTISGPSLSQYNTGHCQRMTGAIQNSGHSIRSLILGLLASCVKMSKCPRVWGWADLWGEAKKYEVSKPGQSRVVGVGANKS